MACPFCGAPYEGPFCPSCGRDAAGAVVAMPALPPAVCARCAASYIGPVCPSCGTPFGAGSPLASLRATGSVFWTLGMLAYFGLLVACLIAFAYAAVLVVQGAIAGGPRYIDLYVLAPFPVYTTIDASAELFVAYFTLLAAAIVAAYAWYGVRDGRATARLFARPLTDFRARFESRSAWIATGQVFLAALFFQLTFILLLALGGYEPALPEYPPGIPEWYMYYALANASVYEEFVARWLLIGVPLVVAALAVRGLRGPGSVGATAVWRHLFGGTLTRESPRPLLLAAAVLVPLSAVVFGLAHVPSWGWWKFFPTALAGLGMGYLFVRHGILAGVLFHFATDYLGALSLFAGDSLGAQLLLVVAVIALVLLGAFFFFVYGWYFVRLHRHFAGTLAPEPAPIAAGGAPAPAAPPAVAAGPTPAPLPAGYGDGWVEFACPRCGGREARYEGGRFTCLGCGHAVP